MESAHVIIKGTCPAKIANSAVVAEGFLKKAVRLFGTTAIDGPRSVMRTGDHPGVTAFVATNWRSIVVQTFTEEPLVVLTYVSSVKEHLREIHSLFLDHFEINPKSVSETTLLDTDLGNMECQEPGCSRSATNEFNGMNVCTDHFEQHKDLHFEQYFKEEFD